MKIKQTILTLGLLLGFGALLAAQPAFALSCGNGSDGEPLQTSIIGGNICKGVNDSGDLKSSGLWAILVLVIQIMTAGVGILAVGGIVYGAVLYVSAADSAEQVKKARTIITNVVIGLIAYGLMYALLNYLIPGGLFG